MGRGAPFCLPHPPSFHVLPWCFFKPLALKVDVWHSLPSELAEHRQSFLGSREVFQPLSFLLQLHREGEKGGGVFEVRRTEGISFGDVGACSFQDVRWRDVLGGIKEDVFDVSGGVWELELRQWGGSLSCMLGSWCPHCYWPHLGIKHTIGKVRSWGGTLKNNPDRSPFPESSLPFPSLNRPTWTTLTSRTVTQLHHQLSC